MNGNLIELAENLDRTEKALSRIRRDPTLITPVAKTVDILQNARENGNTVYAFGNGGSHSNASHFANDLLKACDIKTHCISDMVPTMMAYANDEEYRTIFVRVLRKIVNENDVLIAFSCSGQSDNILAALAIFGGLRKFGVPVKTILFTGDDGGWAVKHKMADIAIKVPHPDIKVQESCHSAICHAIVHALNGGV